MTRADNRGVKIIQNVDAGINSSSVKQINLNGPYVTECAKIALICAVIALTVRIYYMDILNCAIDQCNKCLLI